MHVQWILKRPCTLNLYSLQDILYIMYNYTGLCIIFEIEGVERSLYGYLIFTHCGVIHYILWWNAKSDWETNFKKIKALFGIQDGIVHASDRAAWTVLSKCCWESQSWTVCRIVQLLTCWLRSTTLWLTTDNHIRNAQRKTLFCRYCKDSAKPCVYSVSYTDVGHVQSLICWKFYCILSTMCAWVLSAHAHAGSPLRWIWLKQRNR